MNEKMYYQLVSQAHVISVQTELKNQALAARIKKWEETFATIDSKINNIQQEIENLNQVQNKTSKIFISKVQDLMNLLEQQYKTIQDIEIYSTKERDYIQSLEYNNNKILKICEEDKDKDKDKNKPTTAINLDQSKIIQPANQATKNIEQYMQKLENLFSQTSKYTQALDELNKPLIKFNLPKSISAAVLQIKKLTSKFSFINQNIEKFPSFKQNNSHVLSPLYAALHSFKVQTNMYVQEEQSKPDNKIKPNI